MEKQMFGEFMGTMVLILMGNGVVANTLLRKSKGENAGWLAITTGWALGVMIGVFCAIACGSADANLNPAVTLGAAFHGGDFSKVIPFLAAQMAGAMGGATLVWLNFLPHWSATPEPTLMPRASSPLRRFVYGSNLFSEILGASCWCWRPVRSSRKRFRPPAPRRASGPISWVAWFGASGSASAAPPATPSTRRAISDRASSTPYCPSPRRAGRTGATPRCRSSGRSSAALWRALPCGWWAGADGRSRRRARRQLLHDARTNALASPNSISVLSA